MPIISFWSNNRKETGQTISTIAISTMMAIEHNYKILLISTGFEDRTVNYSFWKENGSKNINVQKMLGLNTTNMNTEAGIEGLSRTVQSNRIRPGLIQDYARVVLKDRLDILPSPETSNKLEYEQIAACYPGVLEMAKSDYNMTFVDLSKRMPIEIQKDVLQKSDVIIVNTNQGLNDVQALFQLRKQNDVFKQEQIMFLLGRYDKFSKYNVKNIMRYLRERQEILTVPYNTLFFEATTEGEVIDYLLKYRTLKDKTDRNAIFIEETIKACNNILYKIQELAINKKI